MPTILPDILAHLDAQQDHAIDRVKQLLAIPSVSTDPAFKPEVDRAAAWVSDYCKQLGLTVETHTPNGGHPIVLAKTTDALVAPDASKRILFYGHYDVQPPDPLDGWTTAPFEPTVRDGKLYARGASDDKGQIMCFLEALKAYVDTRTPLPCHVTVMIEGEEECGSISLPAFLEKDAHRLEAGTPDDTVCVVSDTCMWDANTPAITYALRGLVYFDVKLHGPSRDLHSGVYGGSLANPCTQLTRVLGKLLDDDNKITIPHFYDDVAPLTDDVRQEFEALPFDENDFTADVGATPFGEAHFDTLQRRWVRPACDINGLYGGYMGEGAKTVIPTFAGAKVSFRIPANMSPEKVAQQFTQWIQSHDVGGCRWELTNHGEAWPVAVANDSPWLAAASRALEITAGKKPALVRDGATIPVIADFKSKLGIDTLLIGFGLNADNIHSPDEHFALNRFHLGCRTHAALLAEVGSM
ncbi:MAG: M20/M25/M40 family metallo-hydrolase [Algisphaera sp.]